MHSWPVCPGREQRPGPSSDIRDCDPATVVLDNLRALVVDDNDTNRFILTEMLRSWSIRCTTVPHGSLVVDEFLKGEREKCLAAGIDEYVTKPIVFAKLFDAIARCVPDDPTRPNRSLPRTEAPRLPHSWP